MDYINKFLSNAEPKKLSNLEKLTLSYSIIAQFKHELFDKNYKPRLKKEYYPESQLLDWMDIVSQTPIFKFFKHYFHVDIYGEKNIPDKTGALLIANHATIFLADLAPIYIGVYEKKHRWLYGLAFKMLADSDLLKTIGGVKGERDLGVKILEEDNLAIACPGGIVEACKPFYDNYKIMAVEGFSDDHCGYVKTAWVAKKPIIPVVSIGAEETIFILGNIKPIVKIIIESLYKNPLLHNHPSFQRLYELVDFAKVIPLPLNLFPLKSKVTAYVGEPIDVRELIGNSANQKDFAFVNKLVMTKLQKMINLNLKDKKSLK